MRKTIQSGIGIILALFLMSSCTSYAVYSRNYLAGKNLYAAGRYDDAEKSFQEAAKVQSDAAVFTYLAATAYKKGQFENAAKLIGQAEKSPLDQLSYVRMYGYKALILLSIDKAPGMAALNDYIKRYDCLYPLISINDLKTMRQSGVVDKARVEAIVDEQIEWYEKDMELYIYNHVGFYARESREGP